MTLLQTVCLHGSDKEYFAKKLILSLKELITRKQGNNDPVAFCKQTCSNNAVFSQVAGLVPRAIIVPMPTFWGSLPNLQSFVIDKFPTEFTFNHSNLGD